MFSSGYYGNGYVELPSHSLRRRANFGFVFRTLQSKCLLMLSAYPPATTSMDDGEFDGTGEARGNYSVSLLDGRVYVLLSGRQSIELMSNVTVNDGEYHVLNVQKIGRKFELRIDDQLQQTESFSESPFSVNAPEDRGGLYFGGVPPYQEYEMLADTLVPFVGAIKDVVFNNRTILFNKMINFTNVHMGRDGPTMGIGGWSANNIMKTEFISSSFTPAPEGCHRVSYADHFDCN